MSQFHETFTRASKKDPLLSYDDFASRIFTSGFLTCFLLPITFYLFYKWFGPRGNTLPWNLRLSDIHTENRKLPSFHCACSFCRRHRQEEKNRKYKLSDYLTLSRVAQVLILVFMWWVVFYLVKGINVSDNIKRFDPFDLLGIAIGSTKKDIRKAYRHMSLRYHPDRNPNDPEMAARFILITKAYKALTDEKSRLNYERYGNPDGPGMMKIGIGLPRFLVDESNQIVILSLFFFILLLVMPGVFLWYYNRQKLYAANGIRLETLQLIYYAINENTRHKALPEVYACAAECCQIRTNPSEDLHLKQFLNGLGEIKRKSISRETFRNFVVLLCYINRNDRLPETFKKVQEEVLKYSILITQCMFDVSICRGWMLTVKSILDFRRSLIQGISARRDSLLQIPHFTQEIVGHVQRSKSGVRNVSDYVSKPAQDRRGTVGMSETQLRDVEAFCAYFPKVSLEAEAFVNDSKDIVLNDLLTVRITLERLNMPPNISLVGPVHAPLFPWVKYEEWCFMVNYSDREDKLLAFSFSNSRERRIDHTVQFVADRAGQISLTVVAACDSYFDCDVEKKITITVREPYRGETSDFKIHPDDLALDQEPSAIKKMIGDILGVESTDEEEEVFCD